MGSMIQYENAQLFIAFTSLQASHPGVMGKRASYTKFIRIRTNKPTLGSGFILRVFLTLQELLLLFKTPLNFVGVDA
jgi:hypothetical protein